MQAPNFYRAGSLGAKLIKERQLVQLYQQIIDLLNTTIQTPGGHQGPQTTQAIDTLKTQIDADIPALAALEQEAWEIIGLDQVLGLGGTQALEAAFSVNKGNLKGTMAAVQKLQTKTLQTLEFAAHAGVNALELMPYGPGASEPATIQIKCAGHADVVTLKDLSERADDWNMVLSTFATLAGDPVDSPKLEDIYRGSVNFDIFLLPETWTVLGSVLDVLAKGLSATAAFLTIKKQLQKGGVASPPDLEAKLTEVTDKARAEAAHTLLQLRPGISAEDQARGGGAISKIAVLLNDGCEVHVLPGRKTSPAEFTAHLITSLNTYYAVRDGENPDAPRLSSGDRK